MRLLPVKLLESKSLRIPKIAGIRSRVIELAENRERISTELSGRRLMKRRVRPGNRFWKNAHCLKTTSGAFIKARGKASADGSFYAASE